MLFTHNGLSGPTIINMSKIISDLLEGNDYEEAKPVKVAIDFFPGVGLDVMHENMIKTFEANPKKKIKNLDIQRGAGKSLCQNLGNHGHGWRVVCQ